MSDRWGPPVDVVVGTLDRAWSITSVSASVEDVLGFPADEVVGRRFLGLVAEGDVPSVVDADREAGVRRWASVDVDVRDGEGDWISLRCTLLSVAGSGERTFVLLPRRDPAAARSARLEEHLWRIGVEIEASGVLHQAGLAPDPSRHPQLRRLTGRQWEVLRRLLRGDRVPVIARDLFLSPSTVRNHLAAIFQLFGVHSQTELLAHFAPARPGALAR
ncbi:MAG: Response regulator containing a CheY-like receiver domain and an DNA-binding domain [Actinomycetia bacterium]|nr:Response regulator containing a CheY-like receiver domain and an DNA-binding domain [Actinomycetes bacterium]